MTLAARLLLIIGLALLPPLAIQVWTGVEQRQEREQALRAEAVAQARAVQADIGRLAEGVRQLLVALSGVPAIRDHDTAACSHYLSRIAQQTGDYGLLGANDADGTILCTSLGTLPGAYSNAGRAYHQRAMAGGTFAAGDLVRGTATGRNSIHFALPFLRTDGTPGGIVLASVDQERLNTLLSGAALPPGAVALVLDQAGTVIAEGPEGPARSWLGQPAPQPLRDLLDSRSPRAVELPGPGGQPRLFGIVPPDPVLSGIRVAVALDPARATADLSRAARRNAASLALGVALALAAGTLAVRGLVLRPLQRLAAVADRMGDGIAPETMPGPAGRTGSMPEVGIVFDRMSSALAVRQAERDQAEAGRREEEARYRALFEAIDAGFCIVQLRFDADGRAVDYQFLEINPAFERQTGLAGAQGKWMRDLAPGHEQHWFDLYGRVALTGEPARFENEASTPSRWYSVNAFRIGEPHRHQVAVLFNDITDRRSAEVLMRRTNEQLEAGVAERTAELRRLIAALHEEAQEREAAEDRLRQSQKMEAVGQLTGGIAHDFNNMLQGISASLELLRRRIAQGRVEESGRFLDSARQSVDRAAALTNRLLAFARRQTLDARAVWPDALLDGMEELIRRAMTPAIDVRMGRGGGHWAVLCDPNQLENVLLNLAINARDAMPDGGVLTIAAADREVTVADAAGLEGAAPGQYVALSVSDTGTGMDAQTRARAFEPFYTTKPLGKGTGLGLSQLYGFVRQSGGFVGLDSTPGQGTSVTLFLPRHVDTNGVPAAPATSAAPVMRGGHVLLVDDDPIVRASAGEHLRELGYAVLEAADAAAALQMLVRGPALDALVTDVGLPGTLNGRQLAEAIREQYPGLPVLFITGYAGGVLDEALAPGMSTIAKPFTLDTLAVRLAGAMEAALAHGAR